MIKRNIPVLTVFLVILASLFLTVRNVALAEMEMMEMHDGHQHHADHSSHAPVTGTIIVDHQTEPAEIVAGTPATIRFNIRDGAGSPVRELTITHERLLHVIIISEDFNTFAHIHPEDFGPLTPEIRKKAEYSVRYTFPKAGRYIIAVDSAVKGTPFSRHFTVHVKGVPAMTPVKNDFSRERKFGDYAAILAYPPAGVIAGKEVLLRYTIMKGKEPVEDLGPYLSAPMHMAIVSSDLNNFLHVHGELPGASHAGHHDHMNMDMMNMYVPEKFGPVIEAHAVFPEKGIYHIFSEIKHQGKVILLHFMAEVK